MTAFLKRLALSRRSFLRTSSGAIALPWLDAMSPGLGGGPDQPSRAVFLFSPNGKKMDDWTPQKEGHNVALPYLLEPLAPIQSHVSVFSHLGIDAGRSHGDGPGDHARAAASYLTCAHPRKTKGADVFVGTSVDQLLAQKVGDATVFPSLELGMEGGRRAGSCDSGYACAYSNNISWSSPTTPRAKETQPRAAFERMFGQSGAHAKRDRERLASVLDSARADVTRLQGRIGAEDRAKIDEYLTAVREVEVRLQKLDRIERSQAIPPELLQRRGRAEYPARLRLMYELITLALQSDQTRVLTFMLGNAGSGLSYRFLDIPERHHSLSHHRGDKKKLAKIRAINRYQVEEFARFLTKLEATQDGDESLLHRSLIFYGSGIGDGNRHNHLDLPVLIAGHANGKVRPGFHQRAPKRTPMANAYLAAIQAMGVPAESFADSTGALDLSGSTLPRPLPPAAKPGTSTRRKKIL